MKYVIAGLLMVSGVAHAGLLDSLATGDWKTKETNRYKLDMFGFDARAYEFKTENGMNCVAVFPGGSAKGWQMQCTPQK